MAKRTKKTTASLENLDKALEMVEAHYAPVITGEDTPEIGMSGFLTKEEQMEAAWASHNAPDPEAPTVPSVEEAFELHENVYVEIDGKRYTPDGKQIYFLTREEIEECYQRCVKPKEPKVIFANREAIEKCAAEHKAKKDAAIKAKRDRKIAEALKDGNYHSLGSLQMLAQGRKAA